MISARIALMSSLLALAGCPSDDSSASDAEVDDAQDAAVADGSSQGAKDGGSTARDATEGAPTDSGNVGDPDSGQTPDTPDGESEPMTFGKTYEGGQFHLGPVDWAETKWHNACAPAGGYAPAIRKAEGELLAGLWSGLPNVAQYCDACIQVTSARGKSALLRVVTYGDTTANSIDLSPAAMTLLDSGEYPRTMSWTFAACPHTGNVMYEVQSGSSEWWTSLWVRNARLPLSKVEVKSANHTSFVVMERGGDATLTDPAGFGKGTFTIRLTAVDGRQYEDQFSWPADGIAGKTLTGHGNFP